HGGPPLPALREGMLLRAAGDSAVFRLQGGKRVWIGDRAEEYDGENWDGWAGWDARSVPAPVLQTIPPLLVDGLLVRTAGPDLYRVDRQSLRKVPSWEWVQEQGFSTGGVLYVPDRVLRALPEGSQYWVRAGGTGTVRVFYTAALGRPMPYRVYLPPGYTAEAAAGRRYPVLYLLHGFSGRYD